LTNISDARDYELNGVFMETVANIRGDMLLHNASEETGERRGNSHQDPDQTGEDHARYSYGFKRDSYGVGLGKTDVQRKDMGDEFDPVDDNSSQQEGQDGKRTDDDKKNVDGAGDGLTAAAVGAVDEMLLVVGAHSRGEARDVVTPSREDVSDNLIRAGRRVQAAIGGESYSWFFHLLY
jgi:hypothetical protein